MKRITIFFLSIIFCANTCAGTAVEKVEQYLGELKNKNYHATASYFESSELSEFRELMSFYKELPLEVQSQLLHHFFGPEATEETVEKLSDSEVFASFIKVTFQQLEAVGGLNLEEIEILGQVDEGQDITHVVTRNNVTAGEVEMEQMEVISLKKIKGEWKLLMSAKVKGMPNQIRAAFIRQR
ncbi:hypothetical protein OPS25_10805 [Alteromonas ponticola]|uniref:Nuclear transport factor 2 family protein n=1 Tax=Alteromonas aquimaris TaxID=2998417 RepID=A0ABT3P879_9ALTE|nr:hypothetical protein [Alteromonas aquimaris]MCW8108983.1 hypothetical protein [Alteromonas aquimaris]